MSGYLAVLLAALLHTFSYYMEFSIHFWYIAVFYQLVRLPELQRQYLPPLSYHTLSSGCHCKAAPT